jgi:hypothetical protein
MDVSWLVISGGCPRRLERKKDIHNVTDMCMSPTTQKPEYFFGVFSELIGVVKELLSFIFSHLEKVGFGIFGGFTHHARSWKTPLYVANQTWLLAKSWILGEEMLDSKSRQTRTTLICHDLESDRSFLY